jgi:hypothetical protein
MENRDRLPEVIFNNPQWGKLNNTALCEPLDGLLDLVMTRSEISCDDMDCRVMF